MVKNLPAMQETHVQSLSHEDPWRWEWLPILQYSCLDNTMDRGTWWVTIHGIIESDTTEQFIYILLIYIYLY